MPDPWNIVYCHRYNILIIKENHKTRSQCMREISSSMGNSVNSLDVYSDSLLQKCLRTLGLLVCVWLQSLTTGNRTYFFLITICFVLSLKAKSDAGFEAHKMLCSGSVIFQYRSRSKSWFFFFFIDFQDAKKSSFDLYFLLLTYRRYIYIISFKTKVDANLPLD